MKSGFRLGSVEIARNGVVPAYYQIEARIRAAMEEVFTPDGFVFEADRESYLLRAQALDRPSTVVEISGP